MAHMLYHASHSNIARGCLRRNYSIYSDSVECVECFECAVSGGS